MTGGSTTEAEFLATYDMAAFAPTAVTVDAVTLTIRQGRLCVLLIQRDGHPYRGAWALPGGFKGAAEGLDSAMRRELEEESGIQVAVGHVEQLGTYGDPGRDPRGHVVSVAYLAFIPDLPLPSAGSDARLARFWPLEDLDEPDAPPLAFDHATILADGVERARSKLEYTNLATRFVEDPFTVADLRRVYEAVWGTQVHPNNFRRKVTNTPGFAADTGQTVNLGRGKPAELFRRTEPTTLGTPILRTTDGQGQRR